MKNIVLLSLIFICSKGSCQYEREWNRVIGVTIKVGQLEIAENDFKIPMGANDAKEFCEKLGKGWRLPTKEELNYLYEKKKEIGKYAFEGYKIDDSGERYTFYWTSTVDDKGKQWLIDMNDGQQVLQKKPSKFPGCVRAVRLY